MKKIVRSGVIAGLAFLLMSTAAYSWNFATHAYIAGKIGKWLPFANYNEMYGSMAPDLFNFEFSLMGDPLLRGYTHGIPPDAAHYSPPSAPSNDFMLVWNLAGWGLKKSAAFGYISHNDAWGADFVAHWRAFPTPDPTPPTPIPFPLYEPEGHTWQPPGYVIYLSGALDVVLAFYDVWDLMGLTDDYDTRLMFCHNIVEYAGDLVLKRRVPFIGKQLVLASALRTPAFADLLKAAYPDGFDPLVDAGEPEYRKMIAQYGLILLTPEQTAIGLLSEQLADLAIKYLAFQLGITPEQFEAANPGIRQQLTEFGVLALGAAIQVCESPSSFGLTGMPSYMDELHMVTIPWVKAQLFAHGVTYW